MAKCKGCINCMKRCPTEAIRIRNGKAHIIEDRCIDCGECIRICHNHAKKAVYDSFNTIYNYKYKVALPAPSLYGQFNNLTDIDYVLTGLKMIGFDDVWEVSRSAEIISDLTRKILSKDNIKKPCISSACPAVEKLIAVRFPNLCENLLPVLAPVEIAAKKAREEAVKVSGLNPKDIGIFFISPCPAKVTSAKYPIGHKDLLIDGVLSASDVYMRLLPAMGDIDVPQQLSSSGLVGISWASSGGESSALLRDKYLAADGIENVIKVLEELEDDKLNGLEFIELNACAGGCVGGVLNIENPFVARAKIHTLRKYLPVSLNRFDQRDNSIDDFMWTTKLEYTPVFRLDVDRTVALRKLKEVRSIHETLPGLDCGLCGAPTCRAFAEDIVNEEVSIDQCVRMQLQGGK
ncbi:MAG: 4Fe-4S dicluster domain-containing protein [Ruminococcaceae bacterium]|nr:4Fe-4S dicluster domain-containing protein [Oscillospiraceae bacterium]